MTVATIDSAGGSTTPAAQRQLAARRGDLRPARVMYGANILLAGLPGLVIVAAPTVASEQMFVGVQDRVTLTMLGAIWLAIGVVSVLGLRHPRRYLGVFAMQACYKTIWILAGAVPVWAARPDAVPFALGFGVAVVGFVGALAAARTSRVTR